MEITSYNILCFNVVVVANYLLCHVWYDKYLEIIKLNQVLLSKPFYFKKYKFHLLKTDLVVFKFKHLRLITTRLTSSHKIPSRVAKGTEGAFV